MGKRSRDKGADAERAVATILRTLYPDAARRVSGEEAQGDNLGRDIKGTPGLCVQVKEMAAPSPLRAYEEAKAAAKPGEMPVAFVRQSSRSTSTPFRVVLSVNHFVALIYSARGNGDECVSDFISRSLEPLKDDPQMKARIG